MSKTQLKKELEKMSVSQIAGLVLDLYAARPEAKEYLDFYISPDIDRKLLKAKSAVDKELKRCARRGYPRPRMTRVRRIIRDIESLNPGAEYVIEIMLYSLEKTMILGAESWLNETTQRGAAKLLGDTIRYADKHGLIGLVLGSVRVRIEKIPEDSFYSRNLKELLSETLDDTLSGMACPN